MPEPTKQIDTEVHDGALYLEDEKHEAVLTPPSGSDFGQDAYPDINEKALLRKLDLKLLPAVTLLYLLSFLDRSNGMPLQSYHCLLVSLMSHQSPMRVLRVWWKICI